MWQFSYYPTSPAPHPHNFGLEEEGIGNHKVYLLTFYLEGEKMNIKIACH